ncbi:MAG: hypothetical protein ACLQBL_03030 [Polyangiaceae bacterium]
MRAFGAASAVLLSLAFVASGARDAGAQQAPTAPTAAQLQNPQALPQRPARYAWDKDLLRASFAARDIVDDTVHGKLTSGLWNEIVTRAYVFEEGRTDPVALAARTCSVAYDLWDDVYHVRIPDPSGVDRNSVVANLEGVERKCIDAQDFPIVDRALLKKGKPHFLGVIVEVNPISDETLKQIRQWVTRPTGSTQLGAGDALFASVVGLFVRQIGKADGTRVFRTQTVIP